MKTVWVASLALVASTSALAQSQIYKHVDENGRITYTNRPMKGAVAMDLEPLTTMPAPPAAALTATKAVAAPQAEKALDRAEPVNGRNETLAASARPAVAVVTPVSSRQTTLAAIEPHVQKKRDNDRRRILEDELSTEEQSLASARVSLTQEQQNPQLVAAVRTAQLADNPSAAQLVEFRNNIDKASGRIRGLQATVAEHEKNIEALKKELGALKP